MTKCVIICTLIFGGCALRFPEPFEVISVELINGHLEGELYQPHMRLPTSKSMKFLSLHDFMGNFMDKNGMNAVIRSEDVEIYYDNYKVLLDELSYKSILPVIKIRFRSAINLSAYTRKKKLSLLHSSYLCGKGDTTQDLALYPVYSNGVKLSFPLLVDIKQQPDGMYEYYTYFRTISETDDSQYDLMHSNDDICFLISSTTYGKIVSSNVKVIKNSEIKTLLVQ